MPPSELRENTRHSDLLCAPSTKGPPLLEVIVFVPRRMPPVNECEP